MAETIEGARAATRSRGLGRGVRAAEVGALDTGRRDGYDTAVQSPIAIPTRGEFRGHGLDRTMAARWCRSLLIPLVFIGLVLPAGAESTGAESTVRVAVTEAGVTIDASAAPVADVVLAIGKGADFAVVELVPTRRPITIALRESSLAEALRMVLRADSYLVQYRDGAAGQSVIDKVVLLGPTSESPSTPVPDRAASSIPDNAPAPLRDNAPSATPDRLAARPPERAAAGELRVGDLLLEQASVAGREASPVAPHASSGARAPTRATTPPASGPMAASTPSESVEDTLAVLVPRALQNLRALIDGLSVATESFPPPSR